MMIHPNLKARLEELAAKQGVGYQTLMHEYLVDRVEQELAAEATGNERAPAEEPRPTCCARDGRTPPTPPRSLTKLTSAH